MKKNRVFLCKSWSLNLLMGSWMISDMGNLLTYPKKLMTMVGGVLVILLSYVVFGIFDLLDPCLCVMYKIIDYLVEQEWKKCYCYDSSSSGNDSHKRRGPLDSSSCSATSSSEDEDEDNKHICESLTSEDSSESLSDTLFNRKSLVKDLVRTSSGILRKSKSCPSPLSAADMPGFRLPQAVVERCVSLGGGSRWSDCSCNTCICPKESLYVKTLGLANESSCDVVFIHGFISSSTFWTETVFPNFSKATKSTHRLIAVDLLGFGRSPKPSDSLYTLEDHVDMVVNSVLRPLRVKKFHIVAHSLGCIIALALAARFPHSVKSLTLLAPPYFPVPSGDKASQFVLRQLAPRKIWPPIAFGASMASWYEHLSRTICLVICRHHRLWDNIAKLLTRNRMRTYLIDGFMCHTHHAAWHTLHNVICGTANRIEDFIDVVKELDCNVSIYHGVDDELLPANCSVSLKCRIPKARLKIIPNKDHITIVVGRQKVFATELEQIWKGK